MDEEPSIVNTIIDQTQYFSFYSQHSTSTLTFFQLYQLEPHDIEIGEETGYPYHKRPIKYQRTSKRVPIYKNESESYESLTLKNGRILRFEEEDGLYLLLPYWFESNGYVRKIVERCFRSIKFRLRYLDKIKDEEEGYDEDGEMTYYHLRDQVMESLIVEIRLRRAMRNVLMRWRNYKMDRRHCVDIDPITLNEPEKRVVLYDWRVKQKFIFDAKSLSIHIETALLYHEDGFALPRYPRNPWNNMDFMYRQLVSIYKQLQSYGEIRWAFMTLRNYDFNITLWHQYHHSTITLSAIKRSVTQMDTMGERELLEDFIMMKLQEEINVTDTLIHIYRTGIRYLPNHWYIGKWKRLSMIFYESQYFKQDRRAMIDRQRNELIKYQYRFINDVIATGRVETDS